MEFILNYKQVIVRSIGILLLVLGFATHFWVTPKEGMSQNELAMANLARMEASVSGSSKSNKQAKPDASHYTKAFENTQKKQVEYMTILVMIMGIGLLGYSFISKKS